jgi:uncharacterized protein (TIGR01319 family)
MLALLADIGSTFTKLTVVDLEREEIAATAQAATTVEDINTGLGNAADQVRQCMSLHPSRIAYKLACSSAAGGLRMVPIGLIPELTVEAARRAALGAGAKIVGDFSHELTQEDLHTLAGLQPDILLLTGGTDGGNERVIRHNAQALASSSVRAPVVVAGNRTVAREITETLQTSGLEVWITENVMPEVGELNVQPAQETIRQVFLQRIIVAKGFDKARSSFSGVLMPTPLAVSKASRLLGVGTEEEAGWGDLLLVDVGGATTDVHSIGHGQPTRSGVVLKGLPEPFVKRTVEGDMGIRYNAATILDVAGERRLQRAIGRDELELKTAIGRRTEQVDYLPQDNRESRIDIALARTAVEIAVDRHVGTVQTAYTPFGEMTIQRGKDLTGVGYVIGTGGIFSYSGAAREILEGALFDPENPTSLRPQKPQFRIDKPYIMAAMGLLAEDEPAIALRILKKVLVCV